MRALNFTGFNLQIPTHGERTTAIAVLVAGVIPISAQTSGFMTSPQPTPRASEPATIASPRLRTTFTWTLAGNTVYAVCQWGMISCLARLGSTSAVGQFALAFAITAPVFMLTNLFLRGVQATDARSEYRFGDYFTLRVIGTGTALLIVVGSMVFTHFDFITRAVILLVALAKAVESFTDVIAGLLQKHERLDQVAISMMLKGGISLSAFAAAYIRWHSVIAACIALGISWVSVFVLYDLRLARGTMEAGDAFFSLHRDRLIRLARLAAPVGIVTALGALNVNIPRYVLERYRGASELGIFAALAYAVVALGLIVNALGQSAVVRLSRSFSENRMRDYEGLIKRMSLLGVGAAGAGMILGVIAGRSALRLVYGPVYATALGLLFLFILTAGVNAIGSFLSYGMTAARRFNAQVPVFAATLFACGLASWILIPRWGMYGAAVALIASALTQVVGSFIVVSAAVRQANALNRVNAVDDPMLASEVLVCECGDR